MIWALPVSSAAKLAVFLSATGLLCFLTPGSARADEIYTYSGEVPTSFSITLGTTLTGLALDNLAAGTDISADLVSLMFSGPDSPPLQDGGEFPIGGGLGSGYLTETPTAVQIGTDSLGQIPRGTLLSTYLPHSRRSRTKTLKTFIAPTVHRRPRLSTAFRS